MPVIIFPKLAPFSLSARNDKEQQQCESPRLRVVSNQGSNSYTLFERRPRHSFAGHLGVVANPVNGVDASSETDGLDATSFPLSKQFPASLLVVQDGHYSAPDVRQNFKYLSWQDVSKALQLP